MAPKLIGGVDFGYDVCWLLCLACWECFAVVRNEHANIGAVSFVWLSGLVSCGVVSSHRGVALYLRLHSQYRLSVVS